MMWRDGWLMVPLHNALLHSQAPVDEWLHSAQHVLALKVFFFLDIILAHMCERGCGVWRRMDVQCANMIINVCRYNVQPQQ